MAIVSDLPTELLIKIFHLLDLISLVSVRLTNKSFNDILGSVSLQYDLTLQVSGHVDQHNDEPLHFAFNQVSEHSSTDPIQSLAPNISSSLSSESSAQRRIHQLSISQKLSLLKAFEAAWLSLDLTRKTEIDVVHRPSNIYDLSGGVYVLGDAQDDIMTPSTRSLRYVDLGARVREAELQKKAGSKRKRTRQMVWPKIDIGVHIVDIGIAIHEHDLVACLSTQFTEHPPWQMNVVELNHLHLIKFSTGQPHPLAACPVIHVEECLVDFHRVSVMIEIVGPLLLLLLSRQHADDVADKLFLYDWMRGELLIKEIIPRNSYYGFIFLNPEIVVLPNIKKGILEIIRLPLPTVLAAPQTPSASELPTHDGSETEDTAKQQLKMANVKSTFERICSLELPEIAPLHSYSLISCRADPNPFGYAHTMPQNDSVNPHSRRGYALPFTSDPYNSVALFQCYVSDDGTRATLPHWARRPECFSFIVKRNTLIDLVNGVQAGDLMIKNDIDGVPLIAWSTWGPQNTRWSPPSPADDVNVDDEDEDEDEDDIDEEDGTRWITITAGQREVFLRRGKIVVRDYNQWNVKKAKAMERQRKSDSDLSDDAISDGNGDRLLAEYLKGFTIPNRKSKAKVDRVRIVDSTSSTPSLGYFTEPIESSLPFIEITSEKKYPYDGILMDEERIIGLLTDEASGSVKRIDVFTLSPDPTIAI